MTVMRDARAHQDVAHPVGHPTWVVGSILFLLTFFAFAMTISHDLVSMDVWTANYGSWHLAQTGNSWIEGIRIPLLDHNTYRHEWVLDAPNGHTVIGRSPGVIAAAMPAYWLLGHASFSTTPGGLSAALLSAGSVTLMFMTMRRVLPQRQALLVAAAFGFATPVWSVAANGMWPHTVTVFGICGMAWAASSGRWWLVGMFGGITLWGRLHAAVIVAVFGLLVGLRRRSPAVVLRVGVASSVFLVLMSCWTRWMYGTWNPTASYDTGPFAEHAAAHPLDAVNQLGAWIAPDSGILIWTPVILLLLPALLRAWRDLPDWSRSLVWGGLSYTLLQGTLSRFSGGDVFYGYRLGLEMVACATPALALAAPRMGTVARTLVGPVLAVQFLAIAYGAAKDAAWLPADQAWHHNAFVVAVQAGGLAGWTSVVIAALIGLLVQRMWWSAPPSAPGLEPTAG